MPVLQRVSGLTFNSDLFAGYSPERIKPGDSAQRPLLRAVCVERDVREAADVEVAADGGSHVVGVNGGGVGRARERTTK